MKIIWKGDITCGAARTVRVILSPHNEILIEELSRDYMGGERWSRVPVTHSTDLWMSAVTGAITSMAKELGR